MSTVVIGLSHRSAPLELLESVALSAPQRQQLLNRLADGEQIRETLLLDTCNRIEVYAEVEGFHGAVTAISEALAEVTAVPLTSLRDHLYVHFSDRAVAHLFSVSAGLDSLAVGESQILAQLRESLREGREGGRIGSHLDGLVQQALRVGKRSHSETEIDGVSRSLVERGVSRVEPHLGPLAQQRVLVVGAGAMSSLTAHTLSRAGVGALTVINRTPEAAHRLASAVGARARPWAELPEALAEADLVISCTGAVGHVVEPVLLPQTVHRQAFVDLALPRDVAPEIAQRPGALVVSLTDLGSTAGAQEADQVAAVEALVAEEVQDYIVSRRAAAVVPTVAALRSRAAEVAALELRRLEARLPELDEAQAAQVRLTVHRVVEKLLHAPTVRVKQLAGEGQDYTGALQQLFDLDPRHVDVLSTPPPPVRGAGDESQEATS